MARLQQKRHKEICQNRKGRHFLLKWNALWMGISHSYKAKSKREDRKIVNNWTALLILYIRIYLVHKPSKPSFNSSLDGIVKILWFLDTPTWKICYANSYYWTDLNFLSQKNNQMSQWWILCSWKFRLLKQGFLPHTDQVLGNQHVVKAVFLLGSVARYMRYPCQVVASSVIVVLLHIPLSVIATIVGVFYCNYCGHTVGIKSSGTHHLKEKKPVESISAVHVKEKRNVFGKWSFPTSAQEKGGLAVSYRDCNVQHSSGGPALRS